MSDRTGSATLYEYGAPHPGHAAQANSLVARSQFVAATGYGANEIEVDCTTVDDFCSQRGITSIDVLKIDTEGHELAVLNGAMQMLSSGAVRFVFLEYNSILPSRPRPAVPWLLLRRCSNHWGSNLWPAIPYI
jgi:FkbM family methyltransferase